MYHAAPLQASSQDALESHHLGKLGEEALHTLSDDAFNSALPEETDNTTFYNQMKLKTKRNVSFVRATAVLLQ